MATRPACARRQTVGRAAVVPRLDPPCFLGWGWPELCVPVRRPSSSARRNEEAVAAWGRADAVSGRVASVFGHARPGRLARHSGRWPGAARSRRLGHAAPEGASGGGRGRSPRAVESRDSRSPRRCRSGPQCWLIVLDCPGIAANDPSGYFFFAARLARLARVLACGRGVVALPQVAGLHDRYVRNAA